MSNNSPKIICVNGFFTALGYVIWGVFVLFILIGLGAAISELPTAHLKGINSFGSIGMDSRHFCYNSSISHKEVCSHYTYTTSGNTVENRVAAFCAVLIINFIVLGVLIYNKQSKFKFSWCKS